MTFEAYLINKKIDSDSLKKEEPELWKGLEEIFLQMHPNSFTAQKLYLINPLRRKYPLSENASEAKAPKAKPGKPVIRKAPKLK